MSSNFIVRRAKGLLPIAGLVIVALIAVTTAMTILGNTQADPTASPSAGPSASASPGASLADLPTPFASPTETASPIATALLPSTPPIAIIERRIERDPNGIWRVDVHYPSLKVGSTPFAAEINQSVADMVDSQIAAFEGGPASLRQLPGKLNTLTAAYRVDLLTNQLATYTIRWEDDTSPAHPATTVTTLNFWLLTGQSLTLSDIFGDEQAAMAVLSVDSRAQLSKQLGADYDPTIAEPGTAAAPTNFGGWSLTKAGFKVTFAEYQVGTYADGLPIVVIPWADLAATVNPNGPAAILAGAAPGASPAP
jgi:hypothetical protein